MAGIDFVACVDCGHMVRVANIDLHEMNECKAVKQRPSDKNNNSNSSMPSVAGSSVSSGSSGSSEDERRRRFAARIDACKAQAQAVGKIENCFAVDFTEDVYAAFNVSAPPSTTSSGGKIYNTDKDYVAVAREAGRIEDCRGEIARSLYKQRDNQRPDTPGATTIDDVFTPFGSSWSCPECAVDNVADTMECAGCLFTNTELEAAPNATDYLYYPKISPALTVICSVAIGSVIGGATAALRGRSIAECVVQGAMVGYFGGGFVAGVL